MGRGGGAREEGRMKGLRIRSIIEEDKHRAIVAEDIQLCVHMHRVYVCAFVCELVCGYECVCM